MTGPITERDYWVKFVCEALRAGKGKEECANIATYLVERMKRDTKNPDQSKEGNLK